MSDTMAMSDATAAFFEELARREHEPMLAKGRGAVGVELTNGTETETWLVTTDHQLHAAREFVVSDAAGDIDASLTDPAGPGSVGRGAVAAGSALSISETEP